MNIDTSGSIYGAIYAAGAESKVATPVAEKVDQPAIDLEVHTSEAENNQAMEDIRDLKLEVENDSSMGISEQQGLLSKLEEQLLRQFTKSFGEKEEPVKNENNARAAEKNSEKLANSYQKHSAPSSSSFASVA